MWVLITLLLIREAWLLWPRRKRIKRGLPKSYGQPRSY